MCEYKFINILDDRFNIVLPHILRDDDDCDPIHDEEFASGVDYYSIVEKINNGAALSQLRSYRKILEKKCKVYSSIFVESGFAMIVIGFLRSDQCVLCIEAMKIISNMVLNEESYNYFSDLVELGIIRVFREILKSENSEKTIQHLILWCLSYIMRQSEIIFQTIWEQYTLDTVLSVFEEYRNDDGIMKQNIILLDGFTSFEPLDMDFLFHIAYEMCFLECFSYYPKEVIELFTHIANYQESIQYFEEKGVLMNLLNLIYEVQSYKLILPLIKLYNSISKHDPDLVLPIKNKVFSYLKPKDQLPEVFYNVMIFGYYLACGILPEEDIKGLILSINSNVDSIPSKYFHNIMICFMYFVVSLPVSEVLSLLDYGIIDNFIRILDVEDKSLVFQMLKLLTDLVEQEFLQFNSIQVITCFSENGGIDLINALSPSSDGESRVLENFYSKLSTKNIVL